MKLSKLVLLFCQLVKADLIGWNKYTGLVTENNNVSTNRERHLLSHQDALIRDLVTRNDFTALALFLRIIRRRQENIYQALVIKTNG